MTDSGQHREKNRQSGQNGRLLVYGIDSARPEAEALRRLAASFGLTAAFLAAGRLDDRIGTIEPSETSEEDPAGNSLLLFDGVEDETIRAILRRLREDGLAIRLKAVVTPTNRTWTLGQLLAELEEEHELMTAWHRLDRLVRRADLLMMEPAVLMDEGGFERDVEAAKQFLGAAETKKLTIEKLNEFFFLLSEHLRRLGY